MDRRRRQFVPLSVHFADGKTSIALQERFGPLGLLVWICLLAAAKRSAVQGEVEIGLDTAWSDFGIRGDVPFTAEEFFAFTGRLQQTSRARFTGGERRHGRVTTVTLTQWKVWNATLPTRHDRAQKPSKTATNTTPIQPRARPRAQNRTEQRELPPKDQSLGIVKPSERPSSASGPQARTDGRTDLQKNQKPVGHPPEAVAALIEQATPRSIEEALRE